VLPLEEAKAGAEFLSEQVAEELKEELPAGIRFRIVEIIPIKNLDSRTTLLVAYQIIDGNYRSPVAHFEMDRYAPINRRIFEIIKSYLEIRERVRARS